MRLWVWLGWALALPSCAGDYSLPPTPCDDFCHATRGGGCLDGYEPAACVASCEATGTDTEECRPYLDAVVQCFEQAPDALELRCTYRYDALQFPPCSAELTSLSNCVVLFARTATQP